MNSDIEALRSTAANYRRAAGNQTDLNERRRFLSYAAIYDDLATRQEGRALDQLKKAQKASPSPREGATAVAGSADASGTPTRSEVYP